jgi:hypothetical protein
MHHKLPRTEWMDELVKELAKKGLNMPLQFTDHFVLVEQDWALGYEPEDVATKIMAGEHRYIQVKREPVLAGEQAPEQA